MHGTARSLRQRESPDNAAFQRGGAMCMRSFCESTPGSRVAAVSARYSARALEIPGRP